MHRSNVSKIIPMVRPSLKNINYTIPDDISQYTDHFSIDLSDFDCDRDCD